ATAEEVEMDTTAFFGSEGALPIGRDSIATPMVRYDNRTGDFYLRRHSVAGWYFIAVKVGANSGLREGNPVTVTIDLTVAGEPDPGPIYQNATDGGVFGESGKSSASPESADDPAPVAATQQEAESSALPILGVILGAGGLVAVLIGSGV